MHWQESHIEETLRKYSREELELEKEIAECEKRKHARVDDERSVEVGDKAHIFKSSAAHWKNSADARVRNENLLRDLKQSRARLRTTASFTPTDRELHDRAANYKRFLGPQSHPRSLGDP